jgi:iron complex outermembrane receptor protein/outer membrane receptor for ferrienterochelin and colicins
MQVIRNNGDNTHQYFEKNILKRNTFDLIYQQNFNNNSKLEFKNSLSDFNRDFTSNENFLNANQKNYFSELTYTRPFTNTLLVLGADFQGSKFNPKSFQSFQIRRLIFLSEFFFRTHQVKKATIESGIRTDFTNRYGSFFLPSLAKYLSF